MLDTSELAFLVTGDFKQRYKIDRLPEANLSPLEWAHVSMAVRQAGLQEVPKVHLAPPDGDIQMAFITNAERLAVACRQVDTWSLPQAKNASLNFPTLGQATAAAIADPRTWTTPTPAVKTQPAPAVTGGPPPRRVNTDKAEIFKKHEYQTQRSTAADARRWLEDILCPYCAAPAHVPHGHVAQCRNGHQLLATGNILYAWPDPDNPSYRLPPEAICHAKAETLAELGQWSMLATHLMRSPPPAACEPTQPMADKQPRHWLLRLRRLLLHESAPDENALA